MLFHASLEKSEPTMATPMAVRSAVPVSDRTSSVPLALTLVHAAFQASEKLCPRVPSFVPTINPKTTSPVRARTFAPVKMF